MEQLAYLVNLPTDLVAQIGTPTAGVFNDLLPLAYLIIGIAVGVMILNWVIGKFRGE